MEGFQRATNVGAVTSDDVYNFPALKKADVSIPIVICGSEEVAVLDHSE